MVSRYWGVLFAAIALAVVAFGTGAFVVAMHQPSKPQYPLYGVGFEKPDILPSTPINRSPCVDPQDKEESDLCAQWRAATASEESAFWAMCGVVVTLLGTAGLLITILQGRKALERAHEGNIIAQNIGEAQMRAYLSVVRAELHIDRLDRTHPSLPNFETKLHFHNSGQTPAINVSYYCTSAIAQWRHRNILPELELNFDQVFVTNVTPGGSSQVNATCYGIAVQWREFIKLWKKVDDDTMFGDIPMLIVHGVVFYEDVFGKLFKSRFGFALEDHDPDRRLTSISNLPTVQTRIPSFEAIDKRPDRKRDD
ncbi:hypothetical protein AYR46_03935 [Sphingobium yanoikuyae]|uniref:hypothetical protein n=1 Tax=Sphingobium yanoikuyae TaxID=13690 RepID=UPI0007A747A8|nr:hypothetical protein [Sphingobium yanoikuyae]KZC82518.1 hypothetical protein AYR46_03935 [Sphingobium yanoikuyae]